MKRSGKMQQSVEISKMTCSDDSDSFWAVLLSSAIVQRQIFINEDDDNVTINQPNTTCYVGLIFGVLFLLAICDSRIDPHNITMAWFLSQKYTVGNNQPKYRGGNDLQIQCACSVYLFMQFMMPKSPI